MILDFVVLRNLEEKKLFKLNLDFVSEGLTFLFKKYSFPFLINSSPSFLISVRGGVEGVSPSGGGGLRGGSPPSEKAWGLSFCKSNSSMIFECNNVPITP